MTLATDKLDGGQPIATIPWTSPAEIALSAFGASLGDGYTAKEPLERTSENVTNYRGIGIKVANDGRIADSHSIHNYVGACLGASDSRIRDSDLVNNRDIGLWIARDAGNCQSLMTHCYGARIACYNAGGAWYRSQADTFADSLVGFLGDGGNATICNTLFQHNAVRDCVFRGGVQHLSDCLIYCQREVKEFPAFIVPGLPEFYAKVGVELGDECSLTGGLVELTDWKHPANEYSGRPAEAIWVNGDDVRIATLLKDNDGIDGSIGIRVKRAVRNLRIDCTVVGFHDKNARIIVFDDPHCKGMDITLRVNGYQKPIDDYIDVAAGWTGTLKLVNTASGAVKTFTKGSAH